MVFGFVYIPSNPVDPGIATFHLTYSAFHGWRDEFGTLPQMEEEQIKLYMIVLLLSQDVR